jgi:hypothetical protein
VSVFLRTVFLGVLLAVNFFVVPAATADSNDTLFGRRTGGGSASPTPAAPAPAQPDAGEQESRRASSPFYGTTWCYRAVNGNIGITEFRKNGEMFCSDGLGVKVTLRWELTADPNTVNGCGNRWKLPPDRKTLTQHYAPSRLLRIWYPGTTPPPPTARLRSVIGEPNVYWRFSYNDVGVSEFTFFPDGTWRELLNGQPCRSGVWTPWYGDVIKYDENPDDLFYLSEDGNSLVRFYRGDEGVYQKCYREGYVAVHAISGTKWTFGNNAAVLEFLPDGKIKSVVAGKEKAGKWIAVNVGTVKNATGSSTYSLSFDQTTLTQTSAGKAYVWNRVAGAASVAASQNSPQTPPPSTFPTKAAAPSPESLRADFEALNKKTEALFIEAMRSYNRQDKSNLEELKKRVGIKEIEILQKIQDALNAVAYNGSFEVGELPEEKKRTVNERTLWRIKTTRDRNISSARKSVASRSKSAYEALVKRATAANNLELAKEMSAQILAFSLSPIGNWRECFLSRARIVLEVNGIARHGGENGKWREISPEVFTITREGGAGGMWAGSVWKISSDGKTLTRIDPNPVWRGWTLARE